MGPLPDYALPFSSLPRISLTFLKTLLHPSHPKDNISLKMPPFYFENKHKAIPPVRKAGAEIFSGIIQTFECHHMG